jgi:hypothetical protein
MPGRQDILGLRTFSCVSGAEESENKASTTKYDVWTLCDSLPVEKISSAPINAALRVTGAVKVGSGLFIYMGLARDGSPSQ